jgi:GntR family transcriptional regulator
MEEKVPQLPLYAQLKEEIIARITHGELEPGDRLPSQRELCEQHNMSHMTVRRVINELATEGVIYAIPGKGLYIAEPKQEAELSPLMSFAEYMARRGMVPATRVLDSELVSASTVLAKTLEVEPGTPLVYLCRLRLANDEPIGIGVSYLPHHLCPGLLQHDLAQRSLFITLRDEYGLRLVRSTSVVEAVLADEKQAELLGIILPAALLVRNQITYLDTGQVIEYSRNYNRGDRYQQTMSQNVASLHSNSFAMRNITSKSEKNL